MLLIGYVDECLIAKAKEYSSTPILVTEKNWKDFIQIPNAVGYTFFEEFNNKDDFVGLLDNVDSIEYCPGTQYNVDNRKYLEYVLLIIHQKKSVKNLIDNIYNKEEIKSKLEYFLNLVDNRKDETPQLWVAGPSHTHGIGVKNNQRYGNLIAKKLNKSASFLAAPGAGNVWIADQILRSDIRKDDIVILWVPQIHRLHHYLPKYQSRHVTINSYINHPELNNIVPKKLLADTDHLLYESTTAFHRVINFCNKIEARLFMITSNIDISQDDLVYLHSIPNFYYLIPAKQIDTGTDNIHPGPKQHELYADIIIQQLKKRNWI